MLRPRTRGALSALVEDYICSRIGAPFTSHEAILSLPQFKAQAVRTHLHQLSRKGKLTSHPSGDGKGCVYSREIEREPDSRGYGHVRVTDQFLHLLYLWAQRGPVCGDRMPAPTGRYIGEPLE